MYKRVNKIDDDDMEGMDNERREERTIITSRNSFHRWFASRVREIEMYVEWPNYFRTVKVNDYTFLSLTQGTNIFLIAIRSKIIYRVKQNNSDNDRPVYFLYDNEHISFVEKTCEVRRIEEILNFIVVKDIAHIFGEIFQSIIVRLSDIMPRVSITLMTKALRLSVESIDESILTIIYTYDY